MATVNVKLDTKNIFSKLKIMSNNSNESLSKITQNVARNVMENSKKRIAPNYDTGEILSSIRIDSDGERAILSATSSHLGYFYFGTGKHAFNGNGRQTPWNWHNPISPKWGGRNADGSEKWVYNFEGQSPHMFFNDSLRDTKQQNIGIAKVLYKDNLLKGIR